MKTIIMMSLLASSICFANRESGGRIGAAAVYVDFRSLGVGIDQDSLNTFEELSNEASMNGQLVDQTSEAHGREGESLRCVQLQDATQSYAFIQSLAYSIKYDIQKTGSQRTAVYAGTDCHSFDAATEQDITRY